MNKITLRDISKYWVSKFQCVGISFQHEIGKLIGHMIMGDETWMHHATPETRLISILQRNSKFSKEMTLFWGAKSVLMVKLTINVKYWTDWKKLFVKRDLDVCLRISSCCMTIPCQTCPTQQKSGSSNMEYFNTVTIYSLDLYSSNYHLFESLRLHLSRKCFHRVYGFDARMH